MVVVPEMIGSIVGVYNGKTYNQVEIKVTCHMPAIVATILLYTDLFFSRPRPFVFLSLLSISFLILIPCNGTEMAYYVLICR